MQKIISIKDIAKKNISKLGELYNLDGSLKKSTIFKLKENKFIDNSLINDLDSFTELQAKNYLTNNYAKNFSEDFKNLDGFFIWGESSTPKSRRRIQHIKYYGKTYSFKRGANGVIPGQLPNCRCKVIPLEQKNFIAKNIKKVKSILVASVLGYELILTEDDIKNNNQLSGSGLRKFKELLAVGGGTILQKSSLILDEVYKDNKKYFKARYKILSTDKLLNPTTILIAIILLVNDKETEYNISVDVEQYNLTTQSQVVLFKKDEINNIVDDFITSTKELKNAEEVELLEFGGLEI